MSNPQKVTILGAGAWGTAIACTAARAGSNTQLWGRNSTKLAIQAKENKHPQFPDINLPDNIIYQPNIQQAITDADIIFLAIPTQKMRSFLTDMPELANDTIIVNCSKGLEQEHLQLPHQIIKNFMPQICLTLSGPNFASEIMQNKPAASIVAGAENHHAAIEKTLQSLHHSSFRPYYHFDQIGLEACAIIKNIIAIACGMVMAMDLGENARTALITRSISEMKQLITAFGGNQKIADGLGGIGDLMLTCSSLQSRNCAFGHDVIKGKIDLQDFLDDSANGKKTQTIEGAFSAQAVYQLFPKLDLPISHAIYQILYQQADPAHIMHDFFARPLKSE